MNQPTKLLAMLLTLPLLWACSDDDGGGLEPPPSERPAPNFSLADEWLQTFVDDNPAFNGASMMLLDKENGTIHTVYIGDHSEDTVVLLASTSKAPAATLLMALAEDDENVDFEIDAVIDQYLPWDGIWTGRTTEQLLSNTSGLPALDNAFAGTYGDHLCQFLPFGQLQDCAQTIYQTPVEGDPGTPPGTAFDYGGSQWHLAAAVAEIVGGASIRQLWDQYIAAPCGMAIMQFGNNLGFSTDWTGNPDELAGLENPNIEGGAMSNLADYGAFLQMILNDGACGDTQILSAEALEFMLIDRATPLGGTGNDWGYGMGWWVVDTPEGEDPYLYVDPGFYSAMSWWDTNRDYAGLVLLEDYTGESSVSADLVYQLIPLIEEALDAVQ